MSTLFLFTYKRNKGIPFDRAWAPLYPSFSLGELSLFSCQGGRALPKRNRRFLYSHSHCAMVSLFCPGQFLFLLFFCLPMLLLFFSFPLCRGWQFFSFRQRIDRSPFSLRCDISSVKPHLFSFFFPLMTKIHVVLFPVRCEYPYLFPSWREAARRLFFAE